MFNSKWSRTSLLRRGSKGFFSGGVGPLSNVSAGTALQVTMESAWSRQSWKTTAHASLATRSAGIGGSSAGKSRLKQQIPNVKSITERWRYFVDFLHGFESFYFPKRFIYLRGIAFSGPYRWNFRKARDFVYFIDPLLCIVASRAAFSRHGLLTSR